MLDGSSGGGDSADDTPANGDDTDPGGDPVNGGNGDDTSNGDNPGNGDNGSENGETELELAASILDGKGDPVEHIELGEPDQGYTNEQQVNLNLDVVQGEPGQTEIPVELLIQLDGETLHTLVDTDITPGETGTKTLEYTPIIREIREPGNYTLHFTTGEDSDQTGLTLGEPNFLETLHTPQDNKNTILNALTNIPSELASGTINAYDIKLQRHISNPEAYQEGPGIWSYLPWDMTGEDPESFMYDKLNSGVSHVDFHILTFDDFTKDDMDKIEELMLSQYENVNTINGREVYEISDNQHRIFEREGDMILSTSNPQRSGYTHEEVLSGILDAVDGEVENLTEYIPEDNTGKNQLEWWMNSDMLEEEYVITVTGSTGTGGQSVHPGGASVEPGIDGVIMTYNPDTGLVEDSLYERVGDEDDPVLEIKDTVERDPDDAVSDF